jgi:hypothetical protein
MKFLAKLVQPMNGKSSSFQRSAKLLSNVDAQLVAFCVNHADQLSQLSFTDPGYSGTIYLRYFVIRPSNGSSSNSDLHGKCAITNSVVNRGRAAVASLTQNDR